MKKNSMLRVLPVGLIFLLSALNIAGRSERNAGGQENNAPVVKIIAPENNSRVVAGAQVRFSITVSDKEDGESKYDEINTKEVLLQVKYVRDSSTLPLAAEKTTEKDSGGLAAMLGSNCFNCHNFDTPSIGPAFAEIRKRYQPTSSTMALLEQRVREGSTGIWGEAIMPTHSELSAQQLDNMIKWIMESAAANDVHYYVGAKGVFPVPASSEFSAVVLTASYTDHGIANGDARQQGRDMVVVRIK